MRRRGRYYEGFAPRDRLPRYPQAWHGCVGAWSAGMGPTGIQLRDWSGYQSHMLLVNMTLDTAWIMSGENYALAFDGSNDYAQPGVGAVAPPAAIQSNDFALSFWVYDNNAANSSSCFNFGNAGNANPFFQITKNITPNRFVIQWRNTAGVMAANQADITTVAAGIADTNGLWTHVFMNCDGSKLRVWFNGIYGHTSALDRTAPPASPTDLNLTTMGGLGRTTVASFGAYYLDDIRVYDRPLPIQMGFLLSRRRNIAYEWDDTNRTTYLLVVPTGAGAATCAAATASGTGTVTHGGTGAATCAAAIASGVGLKSKVGTGAATCAKPTAAGVGIKGKIGSGAATCLAATASGVGSMLHQAAGVGTAVCADAIASGTGTLTFVINVTGVELRMTNRKFQYRVDEE